MSSVSAWAAHDASIASSPLPLVCSKLRTVRHGLPASHLISPFVRPERGRACLSHKLCWEFVLHSPVTVPSIRMWRSTAYLQSPPGYCREYQQNKGGIDARDRDRRNQPAVSRPAWASSELTDQVVPRPSRMFAMMICIDMRSVSNAPLPRMQVDARSSTRYDGTSGQAYLRRLDLPLATSDWPHLQNWRRTCGVSSLLDELLLMGSIGLAQFPLHIDRCRRPASRQLPSPGAMMSCPCLCTIASGAQEQGRGWSGTSELLLREHGSVFSSCCAGCVSRYFEAFY